MVIHVDTEIVRALGGASTTAGVVNAIDRAVRGPHYFLLLEHDGEAGLWMAAPLFSNRAAGSRELDEGLKTGLPDKWIGQGSNYSAWQMWKMPSASIEAASMDDETTVADRRRYAFGNDQALIAIARDRESGRNTYRLI